MKATKNIGVIAFISESTIERLPELTGDIDSHAYEVKEALKQKTAYHNLGSMMRQVGGSAPAYPEPQSLNPMAGSESYYLCGYVNYFLTGANSDLSQIQGNKLPYIAYDGLIERHKYPDRLFRVIEFRKEHEGSTIERTAFAIVAKTSDRLAEMITQLTRAQINDSFFHDLKIGLSALQGK
jgi:hypothetical protein